MGYLYLSSLTYHMGPSLYNSPAHMGSATPIWWNYNGKEEVIATDIQCIYNLVKQVCKQRVEQSVTTTATQ